MSEQKSEPTLKEDSVKQVDNSNDITKLVGIVKQQASLNAEIIRILSSSDMTKEQKQRMVEILSKGAEHSSFFMEVIKKKERLADLGIIESIPEKGDVKDPFNKFKNMIASFKAKVDPTIIFRDFKKPDWHEMGYQYQVSINNTANIFRPFINKVSHFINNTYENVLAVVKTVQDSSDSLQTRLYLVGEKRIVRKIEKKFSSLFNMLGFDPKEIQHNVSLSPNISEEELKKNIEATLSKKMSINKSQTGEYNIDILNDLPPDLKLDMLKNVIWPKVTEAIKENMSLNSTIEESKTDNKFIKIIFDFSKENNFKPDLVIHTIKSNPELLNGYKDVDILLKNKDKILENYDKFEKLITNNFIYLEELLKVSEKIKDITLSLPIAEEEKKQFHQDMNDTIVLKKDANIISLEQLKDNVLGVREINTESKNLSRNAT